MRKRSKKCLKMHAEYTKRERRMSILLSEDEQLIVDRYLVFFQITIDNQLLGFAKPFSCLSIKIWKKIILPSSENMT